jgi:hypothetical protein
MTIPLAATQAKLPRSIEILGSSDITTIDWLSVTTDSINNAVQKLAKIGAIQKITLDQSIDLHEWREFDPDYQGLVVEWAPGKETIKFTLEGVILYTDDIIDRFKYDVESLLEMKFPFVIQMKESRYTPGGFSTIDIRSTYLLGCRFSKRPLSIDIGSADLIKQSCDGNATRLIRTSWVTISK